ncbi:MAG: ABC transporter substrate-binding protein [Devosiaceae bacterium]|nr:ABC transporter substrate-binding protein [Devosiaceae bacterium MH13]
MLRSLFLGFGLVLGLAPAAFASDPPNRVVSLNMCTDQLVLALADPGQIVALSRFAADARLSHAADQAAAYPQLPAAAEAVIAHEPDLVLTGRFTDRAAKDMLRRFGYRVEEVAFVRSLEDARTAIRTVGDLLGQQMRAETLITDIDAALDAHRSTPELSALILQRRGYATGTASLTADLLAALGIELASDDLVSTRGGFADLETIVAADPDALIMASLQPEAEDQGSALLQHPVLAERFPASRRMALPERLTLCAGPSLIEAIEHIARERDRFLDRQPGG